MDQYEKNDTQFLQPSYMNDYKDYIWELLDKSAVINAYLCLSAYLRNIYQKLIISCSTYWHTLSGATIVPGKNSN